MMEQAILREGKSPQIVVCIPAYNEEKTIAKIVLLARKYVDKVIVCDDGSMDMTREIAEASGAVVIRHEKNAGKGAAFKLLLEKAREFDPDIVVTLDGDGQHDPNDIPKLLKPILSGDVDIVVGSRFLTQNAEMPFYRKIGDKILNKLVNFFGKQKISDTQSGYRAYSRKAIERMDITTYGIGVDSSILLNAFAQNMKIEEIPITCHYKGLQGSTHHPVKHMFNVAGTILTYVSERRPLLILGLPGTIALSLGLILFVHVVQIFFATKQLAIGTMFISMIAVLAGVFAIFTAITLYAISRLALKINRQ